MYGLMDFDPDGISIMSMYRHGSWRSSHENGHLNVPEIHWLGLRSCDLVSSKAENDAGPGLLRLTARERKRAMKMLEKDALARNAQEIERRRELQVMLMLNMKAEMEILDEREGGMAAWLEEKLECAGKDHI